MLGSRSVSMLVGRLASFGIALAACSATPLGASEANVATARAKAARGAELYERECAACHGKRGEGLTSAPGVMGAGALPTYPREQSLSTNPALNNAAQTQNQDSSRPPGAPSRDPFRTAQDLFSYLSAHMPLPKSRAGSLKPDEYWAITSYMLVAHGSAVPEGDINASNAASVSIAPVK
jgi:mono/diheme cytochrome c family protein